MKLGYQLLMYSNIINILCTLRAMQGWLWVLIQFAEKNWRAVLFPLLQMENLPTMKLNVLPIVKEEICS